MDKGKLQDGTPQSTAFPSEEEREAAVRICVQNVRMHAKRFSRRRGCVLDFNELMSAGLFGCAQALQTYDPHHDVSWKAYAEFRIHGAMQDAIRYTGWGTRRLYEKHATLERAAAVLAQQLGRDGTSEELAHAAHIPLSQLYRWQKHIAHAQRAWNTLSLDDAPKVYQEYVTLTPEEHTVWRTEIQQLLARLPSQEARIMMQHHYNGMTLKEIGHQEGVSESRISQIHTQACSRLAACMAASEAT